MPQAAGAWDRQYIGKAKLREGGLRLGSRVCRTFVEKRASTEMFTSNTSIYGRAYDADAKTP
jgi:hypothetical protein